MARVVSGLVHDLRFMSQSLSSFDPFSCQIKFCSSLKPTAKISTIFILEVKNGFSHTMLYLWCELLLVCLCQFVVKLWIWFSGEQKQPAFVLVLILVLVMILVLLKYRNLLLFICSWFFSFQSLLVLLIASFIFYCCQIITILYGILVYYRFRCYRIIMKLIPIHHPFIPSFIFLNFLH